MVARVRRRWSRERHRCRGRCSGHALEYNRANHLASTCLIWVLVDVDHFFNRVRTYVASEREGKLFADNNGGGSLQFAFRC
jgi:hypothetical protein